MTSYLYRIAQVYYNEYRSDIRKFTFVFPNKRAGLFFQKYLSELIEKPIFSPEIITINDCFFHSSERLLVDRTAELFHIHHIYNEISKNNETFDSFVFWGEMLLSDFDEVDKYLINASQLFTNVKELKEIDYVFDVLTPEQKKAIQHFWAHFLPDSDRKTQKEFIAAWRIMKPVYEQFRKELLAENTATEGMILREISEKLKNDETPDYFIGKQFVFIGFNALNPAEKTLFIELQKRGQADFYWDYEAAELRDENNPASAFFKENTQLFPSKWDISLSFNDINNKDVELFPIPSVVGQTKEVYRILNELFPVPNNENAWIKTAVVLPDENVLVPLLQSLPETIDNVNVTMGFPLKTTPISGLLDAVFELQRRKNSRGMFYHKSVSNILNHQYISALCENESKQILTEMIQTNAVYVHSELFAGNKLLEAIFKPQKEIQYFMGYLLDLLIKLNTAWQNLAGDTQKYRLERDFLFQYYVSLNRVNDLMNSSVEKTEMSMDTLIRLIRQIINGITVPFEGEPLNGLQIMGMLETRGLDFDNLIICSFNEGVFPKKSPSNSFIPYTLRKAFGLPTAEFHDAIAAYHFYRLIHRTKRVFLLYDSSTEGYQTGEVSRYVHQLKYHYGVNITQKNVAYDIRFPAGKEIQVLKTPEIMAKLTPFLQADENAPAFSATSINTYIDCPLQFYLTQVEQMRETDEVQETIKANMFGTIIHAVLESLYKPYEGKIIQKSELVEVARHPLLIEKVIRDAFAVNYFKKTDNESEIELEGNNLLIAKVIKKYVIQILLLDAERTPFLYIESERKCRMRFPLENGKQHVNIKGFVDRVDEKNGVTRILDYKSGAGSLEFKELEKIFEHNNDKRAKYVLQTFLYCLLYENEIGKQLVINPEILYVRNVFKNNFTTHLYDKSIYKETIPVEDFNVYREKFTENLTTCLEEIFNSEIPFIQCTDTKPCTYCPYTVICRR